MFSLLLGFYTIVAVSLFILGLVAFLKNNKLVLNRLFFYFTTSLGLWILSNYFSNNMLLSEDMVLVANHLVLFFSGIALMALFRFTVLVAQNNFFQKHTYIWILGLLSVATTLTPLTVASISRQDTVYAIEFGPLAPVYFFTLAGSIIGSSIVLVQGMRKSTGEQKSQLIAIFCSLVVVAAINMVTNLAIPLLTGSFELTNMGPVTTVILVAGLYYSIVKHRLFDVRLVIARTIAYLLSLAGIIIIYGAIVLAASQTFFSDETTSILRQLFYVLMSIFSGLISIPLKKFFDKLTNRLFYRDAYDPQVLIHDLNHILVSTVDLDEMLAKSSEIIKQHLKPEYCVFGLKETEYAPQRIVGETNKTFKSEDIAVVRSATPQINRAIIIADDLDEGMELKPILRRYDVAILGRLATDLDMGVEGLGYLVLGPKKSGNPYNKQDIKVIEIIANELVIAIQNALRYEEIEKFNITLQEKVDDATRRLKRTNQKLKEIDETKDEFISMASHQLRTPLTSVKGYLSMVLEGDVGKINKQQNRMLEQAYLSSQRMVYLIADLLNVSRLKTGKFVIDTKETDLASIVEAEVEQLKPTAKSRELSLTYKKPKDFPVLMLDETKIRQVIMNFIDNAIYYTPAGGKIEVTLEDKGATIEYRVKDNGIGVPKKEQHNLFSKFYRAANAKNARPDGTGLGLFMAKKVVVAQGGAVIFESGEKKGSTFGFSFVKEKLQPPATEEAK